MAIFILMPVYAAFGFLAHFYRDTITGHMRTDWADICNKVLGVLYVFPLALLMFRHLQSDIKRCDLRFIISYFMSFMSFGIGVVVGFWYDPSKDE